ncbi:hypothetical protein NQ315_003575 [Exocentrus adspersus]|uniref:Uncharacterized protein n=1 Tax=Exocentrus adspersus TaxID=1586481 RepID=A0AAV8VA76_9CUCU|nr:hypothetical protein NQ315_003575 [Exocentrus adspersus]
MFVMFCLPNINHLFLYISKFNRSRCSKGSCKSFLRKVFCINLCCRPKVTEDSIHRKASILSKKEEFNPHPRTTTRRYGVKNRYQPGRTNFSYERGHTSSSCLFGMVLFGYELYSPRNSFDMFVGTFLSGLLCLCIGKPRFSQKDGARQRIGSFIINTFIGFGQFFTVLFCLVGWGWSIWWGVIMVKMASKYYIIDIPNIRT